MKELCEDLGEGISGRNILEGGLRSQKDFSMAVERGYVGNMRPCIHSCAIRNCAEGLKDCVGTRCDSKEMGLSIQCRALPVHCFASELTIAMGILFVS